MGEAGLEEWKLQSGFPWSGWFFLLRGWGVVGGEGTTRLGGLRESAGFEVRVTQIETPERPRQVFHVPRLPF